MFRQERALFRTGQVDPAESARPIDIEGVMHAGQVAVASEQILMAFGALGVVDRLEALFKPVGASRPVEGRPAVAPTCRFRARVGVSALINRVGIEPEIDALY